MNLLGFPRKIIGTSRCERVLFSILRYPLTFWMRTLTFCFGLLFPGVYFGSTLSCVKGLFWEFKYIGQVMCFGTPNPKQDCITEIIKL